MKTKFTLVLTLGLLFNFTYAQKGKISGTINDTEVNDVLPFANVFSK